MAEAIIPYGKQYIDQKDIEAVVAVLKSELITTGPMAKRFEEALAERVGVRYSVVFSSGTAALHAAYFAAGLLPGEEVITTPITFAATANAAFYLGGRPVFVDIVYNSFNIDSDQIEAAITPKTKIIAPVDMTGNPVEIDTIMGIAEKHNLIVVEDASHALGATYKKMPVGATAHMTTFSFHPVKHITTGEGGAVATNDPKLYDKLLLFRSHGITRDNALLKKQEPGPWHQEMQLLGYNYRLTDIQCALGLSQLNKLDWFLTGRREIAAAYNEAFLKCPNIALPPAAADTSPAWHIYVIRLLEGLDKAAVVKGLQERGIGTQVHYMPVYRHPYYADMQDGSYKPDYYPRAEEYYKQALTIPLYPAMTDEEVKQVINEVLEVCAL